MPLQYVLLIKANGWWLYSKPQTARPWHLHLSRMVGVSFTSHALFLFNQVLEQLIQVVSRLLWIARLLFRLKVDERAPKSV